MIKLTKRIFVDGFFRYEDIPNECKTYAETIKKFGGKQDWYDKKAHRFTVNGDLYLMEKLKEK